MRSLFTEMIAIIRALPNRQTVTNVLRILVSALSEIVNELSLEDQGIVYIAKIPTIIGIFFAFKNNRELLYGFGHRVYHTEDPGAKHLKYSVEYMGHKMKDAHSLLGAVQAEMKELLVSIFAINRIAQWNAHILEQEKNNVLIRPRLLSVVPEIEPYVKGISHAH